MKLKVSKDERKPLYERIADAIREQVERGRLRAGQRLPALRVVADEHGWGPDLVFQAYALLAREGTLESAARRGYFVSEHPEIRQQVRRAQILAEFEAFCTSLESHGFTHGEIVEALRPLVGATFKAKTEKPPRDRRR